MARSTDWGFVKMVLDLAFEQDRGRAFFGLDMDDVFKIVESEPANFMKTLKRVDPQNLRHTDVRMAPGLFVELCKKMRKCPLKHKIIQEYDS